jgi:hypothetical protein
MQISEGCGTQPRDIACVRWYFRFKERYVKHQTIFYHDSSSFKKHLLSIGFHQVQSSQIISKEVIMIKSANVALMYGRRFRQVVQKLLLITLFSLFFTHVFAQDQKKERTEQIQDKKQGQENKKSPQIFDPNSNNAEQIVDGVITVYALFNDKNRFAQIRRTTVETGRKTIINADGSSEQINYTYQAVRGETLEKERIRIDQQSPTIRYSLVYNQGEIFGILGETIFKPREEVIKNFENQIWHSIDALLRYKENGSEVSVVGREKHMGVEFIKLQLIDKNRRKTLFFVSAKTFRVMWLEYEDAGVNYRRKFYDYRIVQGTLVPYRSVLFQADKQIEETNLLTITFGQRVEETLFQK